MQSQGSQNEGAPHSPRRRESRHTVPLPHTMKPGGVAAHAPRHIQVGKLGAGSFGLVPRNREAGPRIDRITIVRTDLPLDPAEFP